MKRIFNKLIIIGIKSVGYLPFSVLYGLSDVLYFLLYSIIGYRKKVVINNLKKSFPEKSREEILGIASAYYGFLSDLIVESLKMYTITEEELRDKVQLEGYEELNELFNQGKRLLIVCAHYGNYEYGAVRYTLDARHRVNTVYKQLTTEVFDEFLRKSRSRFGTHLVSTKDLRHLLEKEKEEGILSASGLVSDQTPSAFKGYWMEFLNQDTPVFMGCEQLAKKHDMPVVYGEVDRIKRGYYVLRFKILFLEPDKTRHGEITETFTKIIEEAIKRKPEIWLWSHKRWKKKIPPGLSGDHFSTRYPVRSRVSEVKS